MKINRWICGVKVTERFTFSELTDRLAISYIM